MKKILLTLFSISALSIFGCSEAPFVHPTDENMILIYAQNKSSFNELLHLFKGSKIRKIKLDSPIGLGPEVHKRYWELMRKLNIHTIHIRGKGTSHIEFTVSYSGWATGGESKCYVWSPEPKAPIVDNLDTFRKSHIDFFAYRMIDNMWYIQMQHDG